MKSISTSIESESKTSTKFVRHKNKKDSTNASGNGLPSSTKTDDNENNSNGKKTKKYKNMDKNNNERDDKCFQPNYSSKKQYTLKVKSEEKDHIKVTKHKIEEDDIERNDKCRSDDMRKSIRVDTRNVENGKKNKDKLEKSGDEFKSKISHKEKRKNPTCKENNPKKSKNGKKNNRKNPIQKVAMEVKSAEENHESENSSKCLGSMISAVSGRKKRKTEEPILEKKSKNSKTKNSCRQGIEYIDDIHFLMNTNATSEENLVSEGIGNTNSVRNPVESTKVFVGGLPFDTSKDDVVDHFSSCGVVTDVYFLKFPDSGEFRGSALVNFETEEAARSALEFDGYFIESHNLYLKVMPYNPKQGMAFYPKRMEGSNKVYLGNLAWDTTEFDLWKLFADLNVSQVRLGKDKQSGNFRGYAHVEFSDDLSFHKALHMDQVSLSGRLVKIACALTSNTHNSAS